MPCHVRCSHRGGGVVFGNNATATFSACSARCTCRPWRSSTRALLPLAAPTAPAAPTGHARFGFKSYYLWQDGVLVGVLVGVFGGFFRSPVLADLTPSPVVFALPL